MHALLVFVVRVHCDTRYRDDDTDFVEWGELVAEDPGGDADGGDFFEDAGDGEGDDACSLDDTAIRRLKSITRSVSSKQNTYWYSLATMAKAIAPGARMNPTV